MLGGVGFGGVRVILSRQCLSAPCHRERQAQGVAGIESQVVAKRGRVAHV